MSLMLKLFGRYYIYGPDAAVSMTFFPKQIDQNHNFTVVWYILIL